MTSAVQHTKVVDLPVLWLVPAVPCCWGTWTPTSSRSRSRNGGAKRAPGPPGSGSGRASLWRRTGHREAAPVTLSRWWIKRLPFCASGAAGRIGPYKLSAYVLGTRRPIATLAPAGGSASAPPPTARASAGGGAHPILGGVHHAYWLVEKYGGRHPLPVR